MTRPSQEFWFDVEPCDNDSFDTFLHFDKPEYETQYHVIEYSAYQDLQDRLAVAEKDYAVADAERDTLALRLAKVEALGDSLAEDLGVFLNVSLKIHFPEAREALERWNKFKESK